MGALKIQKWVKTEMQKLGSLPIRAANPRTNVKVPKPDVRRSMPATSTIAGDVTAHHADKKVPNITQTRTKCQ